MRSHFCAPSQLFPMVLLLLLASLYMILVPNAVGRETLVLQASGSFEGVPGTEYAPAKAYYPVTLSARGFFRGVVVASPALFNGPDGNNPYYHHSSQLVQVVNTNLGNWQTTNIEVAPITTTRSAVIEAGGTYQAKVIGPENISFTWGDFIGGEAQTYTARGYFDPSPIANAGPNLALESGTSGTLRGSGSDVHSDRLTYVWTRVFGPDLSLSSTTAPQPRILAPVVTEPATTRMQLVVSDAHSDSLPDTVDIVLYPTGGNIPPIVEAGTGATGTYTSQNQLNGTGSYDFDGTVKFYSWTQLAGSRTKLSNPAAATPTFKQFEPQQSNELYAFELVVSDGLDLSAADTVQFTIQGYGINRVPGSPRETQIYHNHGSVPAVPQMPPSPPATMDFPGVAVPGKGRLRAEVLGTPALFNGPDGNNPGFHLSSAGWSWDGAAVYRFHQTKLEVAPVITNTFFDKDSGGAAKLTVTGPQALSYTFLDFLYGEAQSFEVNVWFRPFGGPPTARAGSYPAAQSGKVIQLNGSASSDPDGDPLSFAWSQTMGPSGTFSNPGSPAPLFKLPQVTQATTIEVSLIVSDGEQSAPATARITVQPAPADADLDGVADSVENAAPNGGDGNKDGTLDRQQANVASLPNAVNAQYVTLASPTGTKLINVRAIDNPTTPPTGTTFPVGCFSFGVQGVTPGAVVPVTFYLPSGVRVNDYQKYGPTAQNTAMHWYLFTYDGRIGARISGNIVTLYFVDGSRGDGDLRVNGYIADPGAPALVNKASAQGWELYR